MANAWWTDSYGTTQLLGKDEVIYVLNGWNGEFYSECYKSDLRGNPLNTEEKFIAKPIKKITNKEFGLYKKIGYEVIRVDNY